MDYDCGYFGKKQRNIAMHFLETKTACLCVTIDVRYFAKTKDSILSMFYVVDDFAI
jgi:hypothetical protein